MRIFALGIEETYLEKLRNEYNHLKNSSPIISISVSDKCDFNEHDKLLISSKLVGNGFDFEQFSKIKESNIIVVLKEYGEELPMEIMKSKMIVHNEQAPVFSLIQKIEIDNYEVFFATTFWTKLQTIFGHCCMSKLDKVAKASAGSLIPAG